MPGGPIELGEPQTLSAATTDEVAYNYDVFVSYRRVDGSRTAHWLREFLLKASLPKSLATRQRPLRVYIDRTYELATDNFWERNIQPALEQSRHLLLIVTPASRL